MQGDVSSGADVQRFFDATITRFGRLDVLVNNAGIGNPPLPIISMPEEAWDRAIAVQGHPRGPAPAPGGRPGRSVLTELTAIGRRRRRKEPPIPELDEAIEAVFEEDVEYVCDFEEGDKVVYPHHGAGLVLKKETRELMGERA